MQEFMLARMKMSDVWSLMELMDDGYLERGPPWLSWSDPVYVACFSEMLMPDPQMSIDTMGSDRILSVADKTPDICCQRHMGIGIWCLYVGELYQLPTYLTSSN